MKTVVFSSKKEMEQAIKATGAKFVLYVNIKAHIHRVGGCGCLWQNRKTRGNFGAYSIYQTYDVAEKDAVLPHKSPPRYGAVAKPVGSVSGRPRVSKLRNCSSQTDTTTRVTNLTGAEKI